MITVEERLKRIETQLNRIADALEYMTKSQKQKEKIQESLLLYLDSPEESD